MVEMIDTKYWRYFINNEFTDIERKYVGKWMYFFDFKDRNRYVTLVKDAVASGSVRMAKLSFNESSPRNPKQGVICFYVDGRDIVAQKRCLQFMLTHDLISHKQNGDLYNISFKFDNQTLAGQYGSDFKASLKLADIMDLHTETFRKDYEK